MTVTDANSTTTTNVRVCDSKNRSGQDGWTKDSKLDNAITALLKNKPGAGFTPGNGTVYVNDIENDGTLVHEISHEMLSRQKGLRYKVRGATELARIALHDYLKLPNKDPYEWDLNKGWLVGYEEQDQEARAATDEKCYLGGLLACIRTPYRYSLP